MSTDPELQDILYLALQEPIGLVLVTNDPHRARQRLYRARTEIQDPALEILQIRMSPLGGSGSSAPGDLVICKRQEPAKAPQPVLPPVSLSDLGL
jgi:hypothetical protein